MSSAVTRVFRLFRLFRARRNAQNSVNGAPTNLRPGEIAFGDSEELLYVAKSNGSLVTFNPNGGGGGGGPGLVVVAGAGGNSVVGLPDNGNNASGPYSVVVGGIDNTASGDYSFVGGGGWDADTNTGGNTASGTYSAVVGGWENAATNNGTFVGGGGANTASGNYSSVVGGENNIASGNFSNVLGGQDNTASGNSSSVFGGRNNTASGMYSSILGGNNNNTDEYNNTHILGSSITASLDNATFVNNLVVAGLPGGDGYIEGGISLRNGTQITVGSFDNMTGGQNGISLHCWVGYELNWQGGHLRKVVSGDTDGTPLSIYMDSPLEFPSGGSTVANMEISAAGLTFPDGTTMTTAASGTGGGSTTVVALTFADPLATDASAGDIFNVTLTGNTTLANPTNPADGKTLRWRISQDSTGGRTVSLGDKFTLPGSASPLAWSTDPNKMDVLAATYHAGRDKWDIVAFVPGY